MSWIGPVLGGLISKNIKTAFLYRIDLYLILTEHDKF